VIAEVAEVRHLALRDLDLGPQLALDLVELPRLSLSLLPRWWGQIIGWQCGADEARRVVRPPSRVPCWPA
jgi:hypothetical protein